MIHTVKASLFGRFRLTLDEERDVTPHKSSKAQGILILLLMAPGMERSRDYLIDKLWSDRQATQGAGSLKTEIYVIRTALGEAKDLLVTRNGTVRLQREAIERDIDATGFEAGPDQELCEGIGIRDPEFSDWLEQQRRNLRCQTPGTSKPRLLLSNPAGSAPLQQSVLSGGFQQTLADWCAEQLVVSKGDLPDLAEAESDVRAFLLEHVVATGRNDVTASMSMTRLTDRRMLYHRVDNMALDPSDFILDAQTYKAINANVDKTIYEIAPPGGTSSEARYLERGAIGAIRLIFRNRSDDLEIARQQLASNFDTIQSGLYLAWMAYALTYLRGERGRSQEELKDEAEDLTRRALELAPQNSMVLALLSYVYTYLLGSPQFGLELAQRSTDINRSNPLGWAFRGVAHYTMGGFEEAYRLTRFARSIAGDGPYKYAVETYFCIAATLANHTDEAIQAGEAAYRMKPDFKASLRYLAVLYAHKKDSTRLRQIIGELRQNEPDFSLQKMLEHSSYPSEILRTAPLVAGSF